MRVEIGEPIRVPEAIVDESGKHIGTKLREVPFKPLTSVDIAAMPLVERVARVKDMQPAYARPHLIELFPHNLREVRPDTLKLAATISDIQSKGLQIRYYDDRRKKLEAERIEEVQAIRQGKRGRRRIEPKIQAVVKQWQDKDEPLKQEQEALKVLRETTIGRFIKDVFFEENGPERFLLAAQDLRGQTPLTSVDIVNLLDEASNCLKSLRSPEHARFFKYKEGTDNFVTEDDARMLKQIVDVSFSDTDRQNRIAIHLQKTARDLLDFYWKNIDVLYGNGEKTPRFAYFHDLLFSAGISRDIDCIGKAIKYVWEKIEGGEKDSFIKEYKELIRIELNEHRHLLQELADDHHRRGLGFPFHDDNFFSLITDELYLQKWDPVRRGCFIGKYSDRIAGFEWFCDFAKRMFGLKTSGEIIVTKGIQELNMRLSEEEKQQVQHFPVIEQLFHLSFPSAHTLSLLLHSLYDRKSFFSEAPPELKQELSALATREGRQRILRNELTRASRRNRIMRERAESNTLIGLMFDNVGVEGTENLSRLYQENRELFERICDQHLWFVVTHGDQFSVRLNPDQANHNIQTLTFYPDARSRGWRIEVITDFTDNNGQFLSRNFILNSSGELLDSSRNSVGAFLWAQLPFENFLLKRLWFITSGVLGDRTPHPPGGEVGHPVEVRRSHWRVLTSTEDRVYTLTSEAARHHAEYVLDTYGIDIYAENLRRRSVGALGQNQVITFVRAVEMSGYPPNQLTFNPALLEQDV